MHKFLLFAAVSLTLGACATAAPVVQARVPGPVPAATFHISSLPADDDAGVEAVDRVVAGELKARGLQEAAMGVDPAYLVEVAVSSRPRGVGAAVPTDNEADIVLPAARRTFCRPFVRSAETATVRIVERISGREVYVASATVATRAPVAAEALVRGALEPLAVTR
jgi:hypothetical protein